MYETRQCKTQYNVCIFAYIEILITALDGTTTPLEPTTLCWRDERERKAFFANFSNLVSVCLNLSLSNF